MVGKRLRELRSERKISQIELSKILGVVMTSISMYELDERTPSPEVLVKMANYFDCSVDYLLSLSDVKKGTINVPDGYVAVLS